MFLIKSDFWVPGGGEWWFDSCFIFITISNKLFVTFVLEFVLFSI